MLLTPHFRYLNLTREMFKIILLYCKHNFIIVMDKTSSNVMALSRFHVVWETLCLWNTLYDVEIVNCWRSQRTNRRPTEGQSSKAVFLLWIFLLVMLQVGVCCVCVVTCCEGTGLLAVVFVMSLSQKESWSTSELRERLAPWNWFKPSSKIFYWPFQGGTSFVDLLCVFSCPVFAMPLCTSV